MCGGVQTGVGAVPPPLSRNAATPPQRAVVSRRPPGGALRPIHKLRGLTDLSFPPPVSHRNVRSQLLPAMPTTVPRAKKHQSRWGEITKDAALQNLPYKVETNHRGQIVLSPHRNRHSAVQEDVQDVLRKHAPNGRQPPGFAIATSEGVKVPDVIWSSPERWNQMQETGDPTTLYQMRRFTIHVLVIPKEPATEVAETIAVEPPFFTPLPLSSERLFVAPLL